MRIASPGAVAAVAAAVALSLSLGLAACTPEPAPIAVPPQPSSTPLFASEEEALAAAEEAYVAYWLAADSVGHDGWQSLEPLQAVVTPSKLAAESESAQELSDANYRLVGNTVARLAQLQSLKAGSDHVTVVAYGCIDISATKLVDESGADATPSDRDEVLALEVTFVSDADGALKVDGSERWPDSSFC
tara:strand:+ start:3540 stop:4106 length:567 start_codon:yes stop_codon:yes gene_type:complete